MVTAKHWTKCPSEQGPIDCIGHIPLKPTLLPTHDQARKEPEESFFLPPVLPSPAGTPSSGLWLEGKEARDVSKEDSTLSSRLVKEGRQASLEEQTEYPAQAAVSQIVFQQIWFLFNSVERTMTRQAGPRCGSRLLWGLMLMEFCDPSTYIHKYKITNINYTCNWLFI